MKGKSSALDGDLVRRCVDGRVNRGGRSPGIRGATQDRYGARAPRDDEDWEGVINSKGFLVLFFKKELLSLVAEGVG